MFGALYHIARNTCRESLREPIYLLMVLSALTLIGLLPTMTLFVFREQVKLVVDSAMATMLFGGWVLAVLSASHSIAQEIDSGTAMLLLAKPVNRPVFILGKILGILAGLTGFCFLCGVATLVAIRVAKDQFWIDNKGLFIFFAAIVVSCGVGGIYNYVTRRSFVMATVLALVVILPLAAVVIRQVPVDEGTGAYAWRVVPALVLVTYAVWTLGILATALSTRLNTIANLLVCAAVFLVGLMSDYVLGRFAQDNWLAGILYAVIPNWQLFWMADALAAEKSIPLSYVAWGGLYVVLFIAFFVLLGVALFADREVGRQSVV
ncbi:MAG: ABC-2 family transporter protein [Lentisphaerae bacterium ADurb.BinA184]|nr:MAG: ABC-2 family transporter protein [Lentisphaerae bacterium ADurb.BinA184]